MVPEYDVDWALSLGPGIRKAYLAWASGGLSNSRSATVDRSQKDLG